MTAAGVVGGIGFALVQMRQFERKRREERAMSFLRSMQDAELYEAARVIGALPDGLSAAEFDARGPEVRRAAHVTYMWTETLGYAVYQRVVPIEMVEDMSGGALRIMWPKLEPWVVELRRREGNPKHFEWYEWLLDRLNERAGAPAVLVGAYERYRSWRP